MPRSGGPHRWAKRPFLLKHLELVAVVRAMKVGLAALIHCRRYDSNDRSHCGTHAPPPHLVGSTTDLRLEEVLRVCHNTRGATDNKGQVTFSVSLPLSNVV